MEERLAAVEAKLDRVLELLSRVEEDTRRNSDVACRYGEKADAVFGVVEGANRVLTMPFRRLGLGIGSIRQTREIEDAGADVDSDAGINE